jgi:outer membrane protein assembly factor BamB
MITIASAAAAMTMGSAAFAQGGRLYVGSLSNLLMHTFTGNGTFQFTGLCNGPVRAMVTEGSQLILGSTDGSIYRFDTATGQITSSFVLPAPAPTAMALHNGVLLVGSGTAPIRRVDPDTGAVLGSFAAPNGGVHAMLVEGDTLYTGANNTFVNKGSALTGGFTFLTACGGAVDCMTMTNGELVLGTLTSTVYRINPGTGAYYGTFQVAEPQTAIVPEGQTLLIASATGVVRRVNRQTGAVLGTLSAPTGIRAMVIDSCPSDFNHSGTLTISDFGAFQAAFVNGDPRTDFNLDGMTSIADFSSYQSAFTAGCQ